MSKYYEPKLDNDMQNPYVDIDEMRIRDEISYRYMHGGFEGTDIKFSICFPEKENYEGRFFQYLPPAANSEDASQKLSGGDDKIKFALTHGAYFVESNLGTLNPFANPKFDHSITYKASAATAEYSRLLAKKVYGEEIKRPFGYVYGGSGGAFKTFSCVENTLAFDGAVPYVNGAQVSVPHNLTIRAHSMRILRHKLNIIIEALQPYGSNNIYENLTQEESDALSDLLGFGFPKGAICGLPLLKDGSLPILIPAIKGTDPQYFIDFWEKEGYAGFDKNSDASRARLFHKTKVIGKYVPLKGEGKAMDNTTGVDTNWQRYKGLSGALGNPLVKVDTMAENDFYLMGCFAYFLTGKAKGRKIYFNEYNEKAIAIAEHFGCDDMMEIMELIEEGDEVLLDNSDYIAASDYHLHAIPDKTYPGYSRLYNDDGSTKYPQREKIINFTGVGSLSGDFEAKMIIEHTFCDESAFPCHADRYKQLVYRTQGEKKAKEKFRLQFIDNALHDDRAEPTGVELSYVTNLQAIHQCLLDLVSWVEKGLEPPAETVYEAKGGELSFSKNAKERKGIQNICKISANGEFSITTKVGEEIRFDVNVEIPENAGSLTNVEWSFEGEKDFPIKTGKKTYATHTYDKPGKYIAVVRAYNERNGDSKTIFTQIRNISKMLVIVE